MAGTSPPPYPLVFLCIYYYTIVICIHVSCASSFAFNFSTTSMSPCDNDLVCWGNASFANHMIELTTNEISTGSGHSLGRVWYARPVRLWDAASGELASFTTTFSFQITVDQKNKNPGGSHNTGDGMAFFLAPYSTNDVLNSGNEVGFLGLFNDSNKYNTTDGSRVVAVEFDTFHNKWDSSSQHVGIDVNSIWSVASTDASLVGDKINLTSNTMMVAKINYDNQTKLLAVDLDIDGASCHVNHTVNLKSFLPQEVAIGFTAATGTSAELHRISFWSFDSSLGEKVVPPASAPAQKIAYTSIPIPHVKSKPSIKYSASTGLSPELRRILSSSPDAAPAPFDFTPPAVPPPEQETPPPTDDSPSAPPPDQETLPPIDDSPSAPPPDQETPPPTDDSPSAPPPDQETPPPDDSPSAPPPPDQEPPPPPYYSPSAPPPPDQETPPPPSAPLHAAPPSHLDNSYQPPPPGKTNWLPKVVAPILGVSVFAIACLLLWLWQKRRGNVEQNEAPNNNESSDEQHGTEADYERGVAGPRRYHYRELAAATGDFSDENRLGRGGFGSVYQGNLLGVDGDRQVAVKLFSSETSSQGRKQFEAEVKIISRLRHRNLVQLLGWCDSPKGLFLVYELVREGSLDKHIHTKPWLLTWPDRYKIIMGLGSALRYLHQEWDQCVVHGDIKTSNIMLDSSYNTKLGDFGLARLVDHGSGPRTTGNIFGTPGYIDPDFVNTRRLSTQSDVYSFGIVILEIVSGRQPVVQSPPFMLLKWVWSLYSQGKTIEAAELRSDEANVRQMERALVVGLWCAHHDPGQRPSIAQAMQVLQSEDAKLPEVPPHMYKLVALPSVIDISTGGYSGVSGSSFSSGVRSSATTGATYSSQSITY